MRRSSRPTAISSVMRSSPVSGCTNRKRDRFTVTSHCRCTAKVCHPRFQSRQYDTVGQEKREALQLSASIICLQKCVAIDPRLSANPAQSRSLDRAMIGDCHWRAAAVRVDATQSDMLRFSHDVKSQFLKRLQHAAFRRVDGKLGHQVSMPASTMKASISGESAGNASAPKVAI